MMMQYQATKTYGHDLGLSCVFRQWRAASHCNRLHGYALSFSLTFEALVLDANGWVIDFGGLKDIKEYLFEMFDHTTLVAIDDPNLQAFHNLADQKLVTLRIVEATGCENFARMVHKFVSKWLNQRHEGSRVRLRAVEVREHGANVARVEAI